MWSIPVELLRSKTFTKVAEEMVFTKMLVQFIFVQVPFFTELAERMALV